MADQNISAMRQAVPNFGTALSLDLDIDPESWPLIGFLLADETYHRAYREEVARISSEVFTPERMIAIYDVNFQLLAAFLQETNDADAIGALRLATDDLVAHVSERAAAAEAFLQGHTAD